jgi:hypothetical protein
LGTSSRKFCDDGTSETNLLVSGKDSIIPFPPQNGQEIDIILEDAQGRVVAIEVKASASIAAQDFKSIKFLAKEVGKNFHRGLVLYTGKEPIPFGPGYRPCQWTPCGDYPSFLNNVI